MNRNMKTKNDKRECECYAPGNYECPCIKCSGNSMCHQFRLCQHCQPSEEKQMKIDIDWLIHDAINFEGEFEQYKLKPEKAEEDLKQALKQLVLERMPKLMKHHDACCRVLKLGACDCGVFEYNKTIRNIIKVINDLFDGRE